MTLYTTDEVKKKERELNDLVWYLLRIKSKLDSAKVEVDREPKRVGYEERGIYFADLFLKQLKNEANNDISKLQKQLNSSFIKLFNYIPMPPPDGPIVTLGGNGTKLYKIQIEGTSGVRVWEYSVRGWCNETLLEMGA